MNNFTFRLAMFFSSFLISFSLIGSNYLDSLQLSSLGKKDPQRVLKGYLHYVNLSTGNSIENAFEASQEFYEYAKDKDSLSYAAQALNYLGTYSQFLNQLDEALEYHKEAILICSKNNLMRELAESNKLIGNVYFRLSKMDSAIVYYYKAVRLSEKNNNPPLRASLMHNMAAIFNRMGSHEKALDFNFQALAIKYTLNDSLGMSKSHTNIGNVYWGKGIDNYDSIVYHYQRALDYIPSTKNKGVFVQNRLNLYNNLSQISENTSRFKESEKYAFKALGLIDNNVNAGLVHKVYHHLIHSFIDQGKSGYLPYLDSSAKYAKLSNSPLFLGDFYETQMRHYYYTGNFKEGEKYRYLFLNYKDTLNNNAKLKAIAEADAKYEKEKLVLENNNEKLENKALWWIVSCLFALGVIIILFFKARIRKKNLEYQKQLLSSNLQSEEKERQRLARELHDGVGQQISSIKLGIENLAGTVKLHEKQVVEVKTSIDHVMDSIRSLSHQMMPLALQRFGIVKALDSLVDRQNKQQKIKFEFIYTAEKGVSVAKEIEIQLYRIVQELLANIIKHSQASEALVQLNLKAESNVLIVRDNGVGIKLGNENEGIGLANIKTRVSVIEGALEHSSRARETIFKISFK